MKKSKLAYALPAVALSLGSGFLLPYSAFAEEELKVLESCDGIENCAIVTSTAELSDAFTAQKSTILMGASFELTDDLRTGADMKLYLNNYSLTSDGWSIINVSGDLVIYAGENGKIVETGGVYAPLYVYNNTTMKSGTIETAGQSVYAAYDTGLFTLDGGTISGGNSSSTTMIASDGAKIVMNGGVVNADTWGVSVFKNSEFEMNDGTINVSSKEGIGVAGNGSASGNNEGTNAKITLNGGTIVSGDLGVYAPQINGTTVLGGNLVINAGKCGVEVRAGELNVEGATINVDANTPYAFNPNGSGSTATGVAIAVAQHTTTQAITATVTGGTFTAPVAFAEANPQHNAEEDVEKVELEITGGTFNATNGDPVVASEDVEKFIAGGTYNKEPDAKYIVEGYSAHSTSDGAIYNVLPNSSAAGIDDTEEDENTDDNEQELGKTANSILNELYNSFNNLDGDEFDEPIELTTESGIKFWVFPGSAKSALENGSTIVAVLDSDDVDLNSLSEEDIEYINSFLEDGMVVFGIAEYWIDLNEAGTGVGGWLGEVSELTNPLTLSYDVSGAPKPAEGATRTWRVVRLHWTLNGGADPQVDVIDAEYDEENELISFANDKYSVFIVTYTDTVAAPETGTMTVAGASAKSAAIVTAVVIGVLVSMTSFAYLMRRR